MDLFDWVSDFTSFSEGTSFELHESGFDNDFAVNLANGLPMIDGIGSLDVAGNPFGCDYSHEPSSSFDASSTGFGDD